MSIIPAPLTVATGGLLWLCYPSQAVNQKSNPHIIFWKKYPYIIFWIVVSVWAIVIICILIVVQDVNCKYLIN